MSEILTTSMLKKEKEGKTKKILLWQPDADSIDEMHVRLFACS